MVGRKDRSLADSKHSIAVLLFEALSENKDDEFLASGITSEVIAHVSRIPNIRVSSRLASFSYRSGRDDIGLVAEQLNTRYIVTGSLRRSGDKILVIAELTDTSSESEIWAQSYERQLEDLFEVQHDISKCIVGAVLGEVKLAESVFAGATPTHKLDAWGLVQKAYYFWLTNFTGESLFQAMEYLREAVKIEPRYPAANAALAMLISQTMNSRITPDFDASAKEARGLIDAAYKQAPNDIDVLENAGLVWLTLSEPERAQQLARRAVELAPLNLIARGYLSLVLAMSGGEEGAREAAELIDENFATAPTHPSGPYWNHFKSLAMQGLGLHEEAVNLARKCICVHPGWTHSYFILANSLVELGDKEGAAKAIETAITFNPYLTAKLHAQNVYEMSNDKQKAQPFINGLSKGEFI